MVLENIMDYLLLLFALFTGWLAARLAEYFGVIGSAGTAKTSIPEQNLSHDYFIGLNYLLHDEPDEAVDTFIDALEINSETVETHMALGTLLRRRGKVDRAIQVHEGLLRRSGLTQTLSSSIQLELARDYIAAGLLDRAENLLHELVDEDAISKWDALNQLITVYQTEKEWQDALEAAALLLKHPRYRRHRSTRTAASHFCCELAEQCMRADDFRQTREWLRKAASYDKHNARTALLFGELESRSGNFRQAIRELKKITQQDPGFIPEMIAPISSCFRRLNAPDELEAYLRDLLAEKVTTTALLTLVDLIRDHHGDAQAIAFLNQHLARKPSTRALNRLLEIQAQHYEDPVRETLQQVRHTLEQIAGSRPLYRCGQCGFEARNLYWLCPSCQRWGTIKPVAGVEDA